MRMSLILLTCCLLGVKLATDLNEKSKIKIESIKASFHYGGAFYITKNNLRKSDSYNSYNKGRSPEAS